MKHLVLSKKFNIFRYSKLEVRYFSHRGFSLVEMLFYVAILAISLVTVMQTLVVITRSYGILRSAQRVEQEASFSLDRMVREVRDASDVSDAESTFSVHPGKLFLTTTTSEGAARTVEFSLTAGKLSLKENGVVTGLLSSDKTSISNLVFRKITTARSKGVKIEMTMQSGTGTTTRSENFYATAVLRDSY